MKNSVPDCYYRISSKALILDTTESRFLLLLEDNGLWGLPGGGIEFGEGAVETLRREIFEETGFEVLSIDNNPVTFYTFLNKHGEWMANIVYKATVSTAHFQKTAECIDFKFYSMDEAKQLPLNYDANAFVKIYKI